MNKILVLIITVLFLTGCSSGTQATSSSGNGTTVAEDLKEVAGDLKETGEDIKDTLSDTFNEAFGDLLGSSSSTNSSETNHAFVQIKESEDKYTAYIKDYVSRNCATVGYESLGGDRNDYVGNGYIRVIMITEDGEYPGISDGELKDYYVVAQSLEPNTEVRYTYQKDSEGNEYDNLIEWQNIDEIVLKVKKVGSSDPTTDKGMTKINVSPDKYTCYVKDYVGRNLAECGYISMLGDFRDRYGTGNLELVIITNDGSYIDLGGDDAAESLKNYVVVGQGVEPNTEIKFEYSKDSNGNEYSFTSWQSREEIELYVEKSPD